MAVEEDIKATERAKSQAETAASNKEKIDAIKKRNEELKKRQADAKRSLRTQKIMYDGYILILSTGKEKNKTISEARRSELRTAAENLNTKISKLEKIIDQKPEDEILDTSGKSYQGKIKSTTAGPTGPVTLQATQTAKETEAKEKADAAAAKKTPGVKGTMPEMPTGDGTLTPSDDAIPSSFDPAIARAGEEIDRPGSPNIPPKAQRDLKTLLASTEFWFDLPDYIFNLDPKLGELLVKAVNNNYDEARFLSEAKLTTWWQKNAAPIRTRIIAKAKYDELRAAGTDVGNTEYALDSATIKRSVQSRARSLGANLGPEQLDQIVSKIYNGFLENDTLAIDSFIAPYIGKITSIVGTGLPGAGTTTTGFSGQALQNYQTLQAIAKANGLSIRDILPGVSATTTGGDLESAILQKLALGELDINRIAQDARIIAGTGQPEYVRNLLNQGYDLGQVYSPYKNIMASVLELNPEEIELKELSGYGLFSDKGGSNIYDFKRALRKDSRWQYTEQAREEVADTTLGILRDFGFQG
jgi:hypothetical protein